MVLDLEWSGHWETLLLHSLEIPELFLCPEFDQFPGVCPAVP